MPAVALGVAIRFCRDQRNLSLRETGRLAEVDHAYIHRLETGEKDSPSPEIMAKLIRVLKPTPRDADLIQYLMDHPAGNPELVKYFLEHPDLRIEYFEAAYGMRHRGTARPEPEVLIARARRMIDEDG